MEALGLWFTAHHQFAGAAVFLIALAESLAIVGLLVPGVAMMFVAGALIGSGALEFGPICASAIAGAIAGDGISFWVGQHFRERLPDLPPFRSQPALLDRGVTFFRRYGGRSILFGRFVGPIRAVIPLIAGMLEMPARRFLVVNVLSAVLWAPAYLLPGMAFGASLDVASQVTSRLVTLLIVLLAGLWFTAWLSKHSYLFLQPRAHRFILFTFDFSRRHPLLGHFTAPLIDPQQRDYPGLALWALVLFALCGAVSALIKPDLLPVALEALRTPWSDYLLTAFSGLAHGRFVAALGLLVALVLGAAGRKVALVHWLAGLGFALILDLGGRFWPNARSAVDGAMLRSIVAYGFLAILLADRLQPANRRWLVYTGAALLVGTLAFARLYLGLGSLATLGFTGGIALAWLTLLGIAYRRHRAQSVPLRELAWISTAATAAMLAFEFESHSISDFERRDTLRTVTREDWLGNGWIALPENRARLFGAPSQELEIQWTASAAELRRALLGAGWTEAASLTAASFVDSLSLLSPPDRLPVLPHFNQGQVDRLRMIRPLAKGVWLILRFWDSGYRLSETAQPIWLGSCGRLTERRLIGSLRYARQRNLSTENCGRIARTIASSAPHYRLIHHHADGRSAWLFWLPKSHRDRDAP